MSHNGGQEHKKWHHCSQDASDRIERIRGVRRSEHGAVYDGLMSIEGKACALYITVCRESCAGTDRWIEKYVA